tara:strand:+ start:1338 stop:1586 length:249 start_codon:yes stop_codon:yes gene_type:complete
MWVMPLAIIIFNKIITFYKVVGFLLGMIGIMILFGQSGVGWSNKQVLFGNGLLLLAAFSWAVPFLCARKMTWHHSQLVLIIW